jgi:hypothetical protein
MHRGLALGLGVVALAAVAAYLARGAIAERARPRIARSVRPIVIRAAARRPLTAAKLVARHPRRAARLAAALR